MHQKNIQPGLSSDRFLYPKADAASALSINIRTRKSNQDCRYRVRAGGNGVSESTRLFAITRDGDRSAGELLMSRGIKVIGTPGENHS
jgi:hypothetical protein